QRYLAPRPIPSFPTRRSSDLERRDPEDVDLLEDALDAERHHRHDPEQSEDDRRVAREQPDQQEQATCCFDSSQREANGVLTENRSEEHTSELQSHLNIVCRLL